MRALLRNGIWYGVVFLIGCVSARSVAQSVECLPDFRLYLHSGEMVEGHEGRVRDSVFSGRSWSGDYFTTDMNMIRDLQIPVNRQTWKGALAGAGTGLALWIHAAMDIEEDPNQHWDMHPGIAGILFIGAGACIGALVGALIFDWESQPIVAY